MDNFTKRFYEQGNKNNKKEGWGADKQYPIPKSKKSSDTFTKVPKSKVDADKTRNEYYVKKKEVAKKMSNKKDNTFLKQLSAIKERVSGGKKSGGFNDPFWYNKK